MYEVNYRYWKWERNLALLTDDLMYARSFLVKELERHSPRWPVFREFETKFERFRLNHKDSVFISVVDHHYELRVTSIRVVVGGMSTLEQP